MRDVVAENYARGERPVGLYRAIPQEDGTLYFRCLETVGGVRRERYTEEFVDRWIADAARRRKPDQAELFLIFDCFRWQQENLVQVPDQPIGVYKQRIENTASQAPGTPPYKPGGAL